MRMYDVHTHIIPEIDDGAKNREQSIQMLKMLKDAGITDVVLTPHYYPFDMPIKKFIEKREKKFNEIADVFDDLGMKAHLGAEVYFSDVLFAYDDLNDLCIDGKNYLLLELPFCERNSQNIISDLHQICANFSVEIILAHLERYPRFFNTAFLEEVNDMGCLVQFDIASLKSCFKKKKIIKYIKKGLIQLAGSDCHNPTTRRPCFDLLKNNVSENIFEYLLSIFDAVK